MNAGHEIDEGPEPATAPKFTRRGLLGALAGATGVAAVFGLGGCTLLPTIPTIPKRPDPTLDDALGWIALDPDGRFALWSPRVEMGQDVLGALRRIAALELGIPEASISVRMAGTADIGRVKATVGSDSVRELFLPLAQACASLRQALLARAAAQLGRPAETLLLNAEAVTASDGVSVMLRALATPPLVLNPRAQTGVALRAPAVLRSHTRTPEVVADPAPPPDLQRLVTGAPLFTADVRLPGMLHATVLHPPWRLELGTRLERVDEAAVRKVSADARLLRLPELDGSALVAPHPALLPALRIAAAAQWTPPAASSAELDPMGLIDIDAKLRHGRLTKDSGSVQEGAWSIDLRLDIPMAAHAAIEPRCAVARFHADGSLEVWCGTQDPFYVRDALARDHGLSTDMVIVHAMRIGGGFGGRAVVNIEREAAFIARAMGAPIKLQWSREDEFLAGFHRAPSSHRIKARLGENGLVTDWWHALSSSHIIFTSAGMPAWMQSFTNLVGDPGTARGQHAPYAFTRQRRSLALTRLPLATGPWRGLGAGPNVLAIEAAMDALARLAGQDPVEFRLRHLAHAAAGAHLESPERLAHVLRRVAARARETPLRTGMTGERIGRGVACGVYKGRSLAAAVAEVVVSAEGVRVTRLWCSHDCGAMVDPRGVRAQVEGNLVWSLGLVLSDELSAPQGTPQAANFGAYPLPRLADMPLLDIDLVASTQAPSGAGETALVAGAGAIFNAVAEAIGRIPERLPLRAAEIAPRS